MHHQSSTAPVMHYSSHSVSLSPPQHPPARASSGQPVHFNVLFSRTLGNLDYLLWSLGLFPSGCPARTSGTICRCLENRSHSLLSFKVFSLFKMHGSFMNCLQLVLPPLSAQLPVWLQFTTDVTLLVWINTGTVFSCSVSTATTKKMKLKPTQT